MGTGVGTGRERRLSEKGKTRECARQWHSPCTESGTIRTRRCKSRGPLKGRLSGRRMEDQKHVVGLRTSI